MANDTDKANNWYEVVCSANIDGHYGPGINWHSRNKPWHPPAGFEYESYMGSR